MNLSHDFTVALSIDEAWGLLTDLERIAPCMPGAKLELVEEGNFHGTVQVKVGPVAMEYRGVAHVSQQDEELRRVVLLATGRETRGQGAASATVVAHLREAENATRVTIETELDVTGRAAQFGRGMLADVSTKVLRQFVQRLEQEVQALS